MKKIKQMMCIGACMILLLTTFMPVFAQENIVTETENNKNNNIKTTNKAAAQRIQELLLQTYSRNPIKNNWFIEINDSIMYKTNIFDDGKVKITDLGANGDEIYQIDNWVYYTSYGDEIGISGVNLENNEKTKIVNELMLFHLEKYNNKIYFIGSKYDDKSNMIYNLYEMNRDGSNLKCILKDNVYAFSFVDNYIFYKNLDDHFLYRVNVDGKNKIKYTDKVGFLDPKGAKHLIINADGYRIQSSGDYIYYLKYVNSFQLDLYKIKKDGTGRKKLLNGIKDFIIYNNMIYAGDGSYSDHGGGIYKISLANDKVTKLTSCYLTEFSIINGQIFYNCFFGKNDLRRELYKMDLNGFNKQKLISY